MDTNMSFTLLSSRANESDVIFTLSFNVSFGSPSMIRCFHGSNTQLFYSGWSRGTRIAELSREVIRSHYINSSYPDMTRVTLTPTSPRQPQTYTCTVTVEGHVNIDSAVNYNFDLKGNGTTTASITGEYSTHHVHYPSSFSSQLQALPLVSLPIGLVMIVLVSPGMPHRQEHHQLAMRCSITMSVAETLATLSWH